MRTMILALLFLLVTNLAGAVEPGVYSCVIDRMVGIQSKREYHGVIEPNQSKFRVKISKLPPMSEREWCSQITGNYPPSIRIFILCNSDYVMQAAIPREEVFVSPGKEHFYGDFGQIFHFKPDLTYTRFQYSVLDEGHCETFWE